VLSNFFESEAWFPGLPAELPPAAVSYVAQQVAVEPDALVAYDWAGRAIKRHRVQIREAFGFREFSKGDEDKLADWLASEVCPVELRDEQLHQAVLVRCRAERLEPPGRPERIIVSARALFERQFCDLIGSRLPDDCRRRLEAIVGARRPSVVVCCRS
jgi:hypothetical protein